MYDDEFKDSALNKDERYYRRHINKVAEKNRKYNEKNKDVYNAIRRENSRKYWLEHKEEIKLRRKTKNINKKSNFGANDEWSITII